jgi:hypothetical protein
MKLSIALTIFAIVTLAATAAITEELDVLSCGTRLIERGATVMDVLKNCGEPTYKDGDKWFYDRGPTQFDVVIYIDGGQVTYMEELDTK